MDTRAWRNLEERKIKWRKFEEEEEWGGGFYVHVCVQPGVSQ